MQDPCKNPALYILQDLQDRSSWVYLCTIFYLGEKELCQEVTLFALLLLTMPHACTFLPIVKKNSSELQSAWGNREPDLPLPLILLSYTQKE